jgi:predicted nucleic acid-binding protein
VRFWDTSAVVPLCVAEPATARVRQLAQSDGALIVWWATRTECLSALARQRREHHIKPTVDVQARRVLRDLTEAWSEVLPGEDLRRRSERLLAVHALRAADAFQLAAALLWSRGRTSGQGFVCLDDRLREAAHHEGFDVLPAREGTHR